MHFVFKKRIYDLLFICQCLGGTDGTIELSKVDLILVILGRLVFKRVLF